MEDLCCCGTCKYHFYEQENQDWFCVNRYSVYYTDFTNYNDTCIDWEGKE